MKTQEFVKVDQSRLDKLPVKVDKATLREMARRNAALGARGATGYKVGDKRYWLALDDQVGQYYPKKFRLRYQSKHLELWVAADKDDVSRGLWYPEGDCRNDYPDRIKVTNKQLKYFSKQFENNIYPVETAAFSKPPKRGGKHQAMRDYFPELGIKKNAYQDRGAGRRIVTLVDNVRDDQFYDTDDSQDLGRIGGFFSSTLNEVFDRNVMSIDSWNWKYGLGANPPSNPVPGDVCASVVGQPFGYEGTFGHEYQHLLEYYEDPAEYSWINEGLSVYSEALLGYSFPAAPMTDVRWDAFMQCLYGNFDEPGEFNPNPKDAGGPENSLTLWGDQDVQNSDEIFCDYGAGGSFIQMLVSQFGASAATFMHRDDDQGLTSVQNLLTSLGSSLSPSDLVHRWNMSLAIDGMLDDGYTLTGGTAGDFMIGAIDAALDWVDPDAYDFPGAPPNGADYVQARANNGDLLGAADIDSISFDGAGTLAPSPVEWTSLDVVDRGPALYSGQGDNLDRAIVREIDVPADPTMANLTFDTLYDMEYLWDYGFVQVSTDGGETWQSLSNASTYDTSDPGADPRVIANLPGFTGESGVPDSEELTDPEAATWTSETFDLTPYAGQTVALAFYYVTDAAVVDSGWFVDNVAVGGNVISDGNDLNDWMSFTEYNPIDVEGFTVQLLSVNNATHQIQIGELPLDANFDGELADAALDAVIGTTADFVGILVTYDESTELITDYAPYELTVNKAKQPGGE